MDKKTELAALAQELAADSTLPLLESNLVFGEGNPDCGVMFIGEAPGVNEDRLGRPFVGRAGKLLDTLIEEMGWKRPDVYISNIVKRRPPENRDPTPEEIKSYSPYLKRQIDIINPPVIAPLGRFAMTYFLPDAKISKDRGRAFRVDGRIIFPLYHPAAALRSTGVLLELKADFAKLPDAISGRVPVIEVEAKRLPEDKTPPQSPLF